MTREIAEPEGPGRAGQQFGGPAPVRPRQVWASNDPRQRDRRIRVLEVVEEFSGTSAARPYAVVQDIDGRRQTRIRLDRFRATPRSGYRLIADVPTGEADPDGPPARTVGAVGTMAGPTGPAFAGLGDTEPGLTPTGSAVGGVAADPSPGSRRAAAEVDGLGPIQAQRALALTGWEWETGQRHGLIPATSDLPDGRWSTAVVEQIRSRLPALAAFTRKGPPVGATRTAAHLAELTGLPVDAAVVSALAAHHLTSCGEFKGRPLFDPILVEQLAGAEPDLLAQLVAERQNWLQTSVHASEAQRELRWSRREFDRALTAYGVTPDAERRVPRDVVAALAADEALRAQLLADRHVGPQRAAELLEIRRTDLHHLVLAGLLLSRSHVDVRFGRRCVSVPLFRVGDLEQLREHPPPGVDWEVVRACRPGDRSPLRDLHS